MATLPDRLEALVDLVESGEDLTSEELTKASRLMALDTARYSREHVLEAVERTRKEDESINNE